MAEALAAHGARLAIAARTDTKAERASREIAELTGGECAPLTADVASEASVVQLGADVDRLFEGRLNIAVNCAGINVRNPIPPALAPTAASLAEHLGATSPDRVLDLILPGLRGLDAVAPGLGPDELARLARRDWLRGRPVAGPVAGVAEGIAPDGALLVRRRDGTLARLRAGTVELADGAVSP